MNARKAEAEGALRNAQVVAALYSVVFVGVIFTGYFLLAGGRLFVGTVLGALVAALAWWLARMIGNAPDGVRGNIPLFAVLLVVSALGVMNALFLNLEGRQVFTEAITSGQDAFGLMGTRANERLVATGAAEKRDRVARLTDALVKEIQNPQNCGQGPEARRIMAEMQAVLPDFRPLSGAVDCRRNEAVVASYRERIALLTENAPWNSRDLNAVVAAANANKLRLQGLEADAGGATAFGLMTRVKPPLRDVDLAYRNAYEGLARGGGRLEDVPRSLPLGPVESLGEWSQLLGLILGRLDKPSTYVYIALAVAFDYIMVYLFGRVRRARQAARGGVAAAPSVGGAW